MSKEEVEAKRRAEEVAKHQAVVVEGIAYPRMAYKKGSDHHRRVDNKAQYDLLLAQWDQTHEESGCPELPANAAHVAGMPKEEKAEKPSKSEKAEKSSKK